LSARSDGRIESFTIVTTAPGPDCESCHNRQPVVLEPDQWATWLDLSADPGPCLRAGLEGVIAVERAVEAVAVG
jgi:putative SOS response-associated peptidase YedK